MAESDLCALRAGLPNDQIEGLAYAIGYVFGLDSERVRAVLRRTRVLNTANTEATGTAQTEEMQDGGWVRFEPDLVTALTFLSPEFALDLFEKESRGVVKVIVGAVQASDVVVPIPWFLRSGEPQDK